MSAPLKQPTHEKATELLPQEMKVNPNLIEHS